MLDPLSSLLILTDTQVKLTAVMHDWATTCRNIRIIVEGCRILDIPILWLEQYPNGLGPTVPEVAALLDGLEPHVKSTFSSLRDPDVNAAFTALGRTQALLVGIEAHVCIFQTAMDLLERGAETHVIADAVSSRTAANREIGIARIGHAGGHITSVETALFELLGDAADSRFKDIMRLIK